MSEINLAFMNEGEGLQARGQETYAIVQILTAQIRAWLQSGKGTDRCKQK